MSKIACETWRLHPLLMNWSYDFLILTIRQGSTPFLPNYTYNIHIHTQSDCQISRQLDNDLVRSQSNRKQKQIVSRSFYTASHNTSPTKLLNSFQSLILTTLDPLLCSTPPYTSYSTRDLLEDGVRGGGWGYLQFSFFFSFFFLIIQTFTHPLIHLYTQTKYTHRRSPSVIEGSLALQTIILHSFFSYFLSTPRIYHSYPFRN